MDDELGMGAGLCKQQSGDACVRREDDGLRRTGLPRLGTRAFSLAPHRAKRTKPLDACCQQEESFSLPACQAPITDMDCSERELSERHRRLRIPDSIGANRPAAPASADNPDAQPKVKPKAKKKGGKGGNATSEEPANVKGFLDSALSV